MTVFCIGSLDAALRCSFLYGNEWLELPLEERGHNHWHCVHSTGIRFDLQVEQGDTHWAYELSFDAP